MKKRDRKFSPKRLENLIAYLVAKCGTMDETKLCWMLYNIDMAAYAELGKSLTGLTYVKGPNNPIPCHK